MTPATNPAPDRVSTLELFFDLVFVFTITQVSTVVEHAPDWAGLARAALEVWVIAWMYGGYAYLTNSAGPDSWQRRLLLLAGMAGFFVCALAVPRAFDENGIVFGAGYLLVNILHFAGLALRPGRTSLTAIYRLAPFNLLSAGLVLAAGWTHGTADWLLWGGAVALQIATPLLARSSEGFMLNAAHFAERHGLMILIVLGESLISVGLAVEHHDQVDNSLLYGALAGLAATSAMWWAYFVGEDERAAETFAASPPKARVDQGLIGYGFAHLVMIYGLIAVAAGTKLSVNDLTAQASLAGSWLIAGGAATYLLGGALFRVALRFASPWTRVAGAAVCLTAVVAGTRGSTATELAVLAVYIAAVLLVEHVLDARHHPRESMS